MNGEGLTAAAFAASLSSYRDAGLTYADLCAVVCQAWEVEAGAEPALTVRPIVGGDGTAAVEVAWGPLVSHLPPPAVRSVAEGLFAAAETADGAAIIGRELRRCRNRVLGDRVATWLVPIYLRDRAESVAARHCGDIAVSD